MQNRITINPEVLMQACKEARQLTKLTGNKNKAAFTTRMGQRVMPANLSSVLEALIATLAEGNATHIEIRRSEVSPVEAAQILGITRPEVMALIRSGKLPAAIQGKFYAIKVSDLETLAVKLEKHAESPAPAVQEEQKKPVAKRNESIQNIKGMVATIQTSKAYGKVRHATLKHFFYAGA